MSVSAPKWREESQRGTGDSSQRIVRIGTKVVKTSGAGSSLSSCLGERSSISENHLSLQAKCPGLAFQPIHQAGLSGSFSLRLLGGAAHSMALLGARLGKHNRGRCVILTRLYIKTTQDFNR